MSLWKRIQAAPRGVLPDGLVTRIAIVAGAGIIAALVLTTSLTGPAEGPEAVVEVPASATASLQQRVETAIATEARRAAAAEAAAQRAAAAALEAQERDRALPGPTLPQTPALGAGLAGFDPGGDGTGAPGGEAAAGLTGIVPQTEAEAVLRETLRLEAIERQTRSLRTEPLVLTYRAAAGTAATPPPPPLQPVPAAALPLPAPPSVPGTPGQPQTLENSIEAAGEFMSMLAQLDAAEQAAGIPLITDMPVLARAAEAAALGGVGDVIGAVTDTGPATVEVGEVPEGWDRITEGSFLEAVLVTQLNGDFPGPVLAQVSVPFYSTDRQRVLIPRGSRVVGTAGAVADPDQSRLAVGFHRLLWPDGRSVALTFSGLNQAGESALRDEVDRHYFSTFLAAGAVGILSGLTLRGANPYAGGRAGIQAGAGQGLGESATQILDRFLNRLPTLTIRAGHRLRIWFTNDVLVPPAPVAVEAP